MDDLISALAERVLILFPAPSDDRGLTEAPIAEALQTAGIEAGDWAALYRGDHEICGITALTPAMATPTLILKSDVQFVPKMDWVQPLDRRAPVLVDEANARNLWELIFKRNPEATDFVRDQIGMARRTLSDVLATLESWDVLLEPLVRASGVASFAKVPLDAILVFAAYLAHYANTGRSTSVGVIVEELASQAGASAATVRDVEQRLRLADRGIGSILEMGQATLDRVQKTAPTVHVEFADKLLADAFRIHESTAPDASGLATHHIVAALLSDGSVDAYLQQLNFDTDQIRRALIEHVETDADEDSDAWRRVLVTTGPFGMRGAMSTDVWTLNDSLGYSAYATAISDAVLHAEPPLTIGIQAAWGQGKTSLMKMIQRNLDRASEGRADVASSADLSGAIESTYRHLLRWCGKPDAFDKLISSVRRFFRCPDPIADTSGAADATQGMLPVTDGQLPTVWFNPLYYRETQQVWAGLAHAILHQLVQQLPGQVQRERFWLRLQLSRINIGALRRDIHRTVLARAIPIGIFWLLAALVVPFFPFYASTKIALSSAGVAFGVLSAWGQLTRVLDKRTLDRAFEKYVSEPDYQTQLGILHLVDHDLDRALRLLVGDRPIAVFIDDLDRCDPETVAQIILAINQFVSVRNRRVYFFLGMDMDMVAAALEKAQQETASIPTSTYRRGFGWRFMEKFVQLPFVIPHLDEKVALRFAREQVSGIVESSSPSTAPPPEVAATIERVQRAKTPVEVGQIARRVLAGDLPVAERARLQNEFAKQTAKLMHEPQGDELQKIIDLAVADLELNPRAIKRYFSLVRILRNVQIATGAASTADMDRKIVLRAAHLLMNWPQFVQWLRSNPTLHDHGGWKSSINIADAVAKDYGAWCARLKELLGDSPPSFLLDPALFRYLDKIAADRPGLREMYAARMF